MQIIYQKITPTCFNTAYKSTITFLQHTIITKWGIGGAGGGGAIALLHHWTLRGQSVNHMVADPLTLLWLSQDNKA